MFSLKKIRKYFNYWEYYLEVFVKSRTGRGILDPQKNGEYKLLKNILNKKENAIVFDIGANIGEYSKFVLSANKSERLKVFSIEADPRNFSKLSKNISDKRITFINCAINSKPGIVNLFISGDLNDCPGSNSIYKQESISEESISVKAKTILEIKEEFQVGKITLIKIDIEGAEVDAIYGMRKLLYDREVDYIQLEYNQTWISAKKSMKDIFDIAFEYNYSLFRISLNELIPLERYTPLVDDFNFQNLLLVSPNSRLPIKPGKNKIPF
tara:strand:- start:493 stop:1296 length:804 start_codon:yes stop_codon:yes gene_type:complete